MLFSRIVDFHVSGLRGQIAAGGAAQKMFSSESHMAEGQHCRLGGRLRHRYSQLPISLLPKNIGSRRVLFIGISLLALCIGSQRSHAIGRRRGYELFWGRSSRIRWQRTVKSGIIALRMRNGRNE
jgi:hypothetical protein